MRAAHWLLTAALALAISLPAAAQTPAPNFPFHPSFEGNPQSTWLRWWEANKDEYLPPPPPRPPVPRGVRSFVEKALIHATNASQPAQRAASALALGRMGFSDTALLRLTQLTTDADPRVRANAWIALGLLDAPKAREFLLQRRTLDESDTIAWVTALGLLDKPDDHVISALKWFVAQKQSTSAAQMAVWSIGSLNPPNTRDIMLAVLNNTDSPELACAAIEGLGAAHDPRDVPLLLDLLGHNGLALRLGVDRALCTHATIMINGGNTYQFYIGTSRTCAAMALSHYDDLDAAALQVGVTPATVRTTMDRYLLFFENNLDEYFKDLLLINLGRLGDLDALPGLIQVLNGVRLDPTAYTSAPVTPTLTNQGLSQSYRMFGAIAIGLHMRRLAEQQVKFRKAQVAGARPDPWDLQRTDQILLATNQLANRMINHGEWGEVRAAAALGIGLSGRRESGDIFVQYRGIIGQANDLVPGFAVLAMAMLHDPRAIGGVDRMFTGPPNPTLNVTRILGNDVSATPGMEHIFSPTPDRQQANYGNITRTPMEAILSRRAALLGLSYVNDPKASPWLHAAWGDEYSISQAAATALATRGDYQDTESLVAILDDTKTTVAPVLGAWTLGEMFDRSGRLKRLNTDSDFLPEDFRHWGQWYAPPPAQTWAAWESDLIYDHDLWPIHSLANEFLFRTSLAYKSDPSVPPNWISYPPISFQSARPVVIVRP